MVQQQHKRQPMKRISSFVLLILLGGSLFSLTTGTTSQAQAPTLPPEVNVWARQLVEQLSVAIREAVIALPANELGEIKLRAGRVLNVLVGKQSPDYQAQAGDPQGADGVGVGTYLERLRSAIEPRAQTNERLRPLLFALNMLQAYHRESLDHLREIIGTRNEEAARRNLTQSLAFLVASRGSSEDPLSEGGARALLLQLGRL